MGQADAERVANEVRHAEVLLETGAMSRPWTTGAGKVRLKRRIEFFSSGLGRFGSEARVLELGCGTGIFTSELVRVYPRLTAVDIAPVLVSEARRRAPAARIEVRDAHATGFPAGSFDIVLGCSILHHLDWPRAAAEVRRLLAPGGLALFSEPNLLNPFIFVQKNWAWLKVRMGDSPDEYAFTAREIRRAFDAAGFGRTEVRAFEFLFPFVPDSWVGPILAIESGIERTPLRAFGGSILIRAEAA